MAPLAALVLLLVRAAAGCGGDETADPPALAADDAASQPRDDASDPITEPEGGTTVDVGQPTFCTGIVFYSSFDQAAIAEIGAGPTRPDGGISFADGRYAEAVSLVAGDAGAMAVFYDREDAGPDAAPTTPIIYPEQEGTLAYWYRRTAPITSTFACHVRPFGASNSALGIVIAKQGSQFGLWTNLGGQPVLTFSEEQLAPFMRGTDFDHIAMAWRTGDADAGKASLARLAINGGLGEIVADGGYDAEAVVAADASPDDAGNPRFPYRAESTTPFPGGSLRTLRIGGVASTAPQGSFDDLAIWNRVLSFEEIAELYESGSDLRSVCGL
jgi:hypothetical protein